MYTGGRTKLLLQGSMQALAIKAAAQEHKQQHLKTSQVRTVWSQEAEASRGWLGLKARAGTGPSCPASTSSSLPVRTLHTYIWNVSNEPAHITCNTPVFE